METDGKIQVMKKGGCAAPDRFLTRPTCALNVAGLRLRPPMKLLYDMRGTAPSKRQLANGVLTVATVAKWLTA
jgi:hypothetical protein